MITSFSKAQKPPGSSAVALPQNKKKKENRETPTPSEASHPWQSAMISHKPFRYPFPAGNNSALTQSMYVLLSVRAGSYIHSPMGHHVQKMGERAGS